MRLCKTIEPETAATIIDYDAANNVAWRAPGLNYLSTTSCDRTSVASSGKITYKYDPLNRPSMTTYPDGSPGVAPTYYANGLLQTMGSGISHWSYGYNRRGLLETEQLSYGGKTYTLKRSYDQHGNLSRLTYPDGAAVDLAPNALGEPARVGNYANAIRYYPTGAVASFTYGNGITHAMTPNVRGLPQRTIDAGVINDAYTYDANGNVQSITDAQLNSANRTMAYDNLDRLRSVSAPNLWGTATYTYDALDNLTSSTVSAGAKARTMTHTYDAATNRLASLTGTAAYSATFGYDPRGNITRRGAQVFAFDYANRMRSATGKGTYDYDGFGRRVSVVGADNVNRIQVYSRDAQLVFAGVSSLPATSGVKYIYLGNHILAEVSAGGVQYNHTDGLGSPVARTDGNRAIVGGHTRYEPYGLIAAGPAGTLGFTGHVNATDVGLVYMQQRYYDPVAGRFLSVDPVGTDVGTGDSFSRYAYARNSPQKYIDPDGRFDKQTCVDMVGNCNTYGALEKSSDKTGAQNRTTAQHVFSAMGEVLENGLKIYAQALVLLVPEIAATERLAASVGAGAIGASATTTLFRAVSENEWRHLQTVGKFTAGPNSLSGKWMAESAEHAKKWGDLMNGPGKSRIIRIELPTNEASKLMRVDRLDGIGPARYGELDQLSNAVFKEHK